MVSTATVQIDENSIAPDGVGEHREGRVSPVGRAFPVGRRRLAQMEHDVVVARRVLWRTDKTASAA
jgi:hypothetical protein